MRTLPWPAGLDSSLKTRKMWTRESDFKSYRLVTEPLILRAMGWIYVATAEHNQWGHRIYRIWKADKTP